MKAKSIGAVLAILVLVVALFGVVMPVSAEDAVTPDPNTIEVTETTAPPPAESGTTLTASITFRAKWEVLYAWQIAKSVTPATWNLFAGDSGTSEYTVSATKSTVYNRATFVGKVVVTNGGTVATEGLTINVKIYDDPGAGGNLVMTIPVSVSGPLAPGETKEFNFSGYVNNPGDFSGKTLKATADITITNHSGHLGEAFGPSPSATSGPFPSSPNVVTNDSLTVNDDNGMSWTNNASFTEKYSHTFTCDQDAGVHTNTITAVETRNTLTKQATVTVNCYDLSVTKDASTSFNRKYQWNIAKTGSQSALTLALGEKFLVDYSVTVGLNSVTPYVDSGWAVSGNIAVHNPAPIPATINSIGDVISPDIAAAVTCGVTFPYTLAAGGTLNCTYGANLPDGSARTNTATAVLQNYSYDKSGSGTAAGTTGFNGTAAVSFETATMGEIDECIAVTDTLGGTLGTVCKSDSLPKTFTYSYYVGPYDVCGPYQVKNIASFITNDTAASGSAEWTVDITVPCATGCSLTPGYWKTHSSYGPAPYDDTWAKLPYAEGTPFFLSGQSWYNVLWTNPRGNAYYILAHAYIAAYLNDLNGADISAISGDMAWAASFFATHTPSATLTSAERAVVIATATKLDNYNNGLIGPGHCNE